MKSMPTVSKFMTMSPHTVNADLTLDQAEKLMRDYHIRHLPVLRAGSLIGILSDRDIKLVESFKDVDARKVRVDEAYTPEPVTIAPSTPLDEVCRLMVDRKIGCALIVDNHKLVGIFTWVDALMAMRELLNQRFHH